jgi:hypothetical protein
MSSYQKRKGPCIDKKRQKTEKEANETAVKDQIQEVQSQADLDYWTVPLQMEEQEEEDGDQMEYLCAGEDKQPKPNDCTRSEEEDEIAATVDGIDLMTVDDARNDATHGEEAGRTWKPLRFCRRLPLAQDASTACLFFHESDVLYPHLQCINTHDLYRFPCLPCTKLNAAKVPGFPAASVSGGFAQQNGASLLATGKGQRGQRDALPVCREVSFPATVLSEFGRSSSFGRGPNVSAKGSRCRPVCQAIPPPGASPRRRALRTSSTISATWLWRSSCRERASVRRSRHSGKNGRDQTRYAPSKAVKKDRNLLARS